MKQDSLREKIQIIIRCSPTTMSEDINLIDEMTDAIIALFREAVEECEPTAKSDQYSYEAGVSDTKKALMEVLK